RVKQVGGRVMLLGLASGGVDGGDHGGPTRQRTADHLDRVNVEPLARAGGSGHDRLPTGPGQLAAVADLPASLGVAGCLVEDDRAARPLAQALGLGSAVGDCHDLRRSLQGLVAEEGRLARALGALAVKIDGATEQLPTLHLTTRSVASLFAGSVVAGAVGPDAACCSQL